MKKWYIVVIIVQFVLVVIFLVYALVQRTQALKSYDLANEAQARAEQNAMLAHQQQAIAAENERRAVAAQAEAVRQLEECKKRGRK